MKVILTDIDGVVLQWKPAYESYMEKIGVDPLHMKDRIDKIDPATLGVTFTKEALEYVQMFQTDPVYGDIAPYDDAISGMTTLYNAGWKFIGITCCGNHETVVRLRYENIEKYFPGMFLNIHTLDVHESKEECLKQYDPSYWIDDVPKHVLSGIKCGHETFWMKRFPDLFPFNPKCNIVYNWDQIVEHLNWNGEI